ncbi:hypothetical protein B8W69_15420 [Mycobacterium vulneris]|uniref:Uncharacterized protein n=1 Tax=Mycolicibacterium vulneris TaxID=547163 RepID=A0A1X2KZ31_9MYCO|nr:hypothetical protein B8W69_15420 [Mycolicibacterium vulneris]
MERSSISLAGLPRFKHFVEARCWALTFGVRRRSNSNGALAKSRILRTVPASQAVLSTYADYHSNA